MSGTGKRVLVSGAGIAGTTLAHWLARAGFEVTVIDPADGLREGGSPIDVRGPAVRIADRMGISTQLRQADIDTEGLSFVDDDGRQQAHLPLRAIREATGSLQYELVRAELVRILYQATADDVDYRFGDSIVALEQGDTEVHVRFRNAPSERFDLVLGADGTHSIVRRLAFGDEQQFLHDLAYDVAVIQIDPGLGRQNWAVAHNQPGRMACVYTPPGRSDALFLFRRPENARYIDSERSDQELQKQRIAEVFADDGWQLPRLLELLDASDQFYVDAIGQIRLPRWSRERVALVGDAAHSLPLFGDGSTQAMTGAYLLAGELATAPDHRTAFTRYEQHQRPLVRQAHRGLGAATGLLIPHTAGAIRRRNTLLRLSRVLPAISRLQRWTPNNAARKLPDYTFRAC